MNKYQTKER